MTDMKPLARPKSPHSAATTLNDGPSEVIEPALADLRKCLSEPEVIAVMDRVPAHLQVSAAVEFTRRRIAAREIRTAALRYVGYGRLKDALGQAPAEALIANL